MTLREKLIVLRDKAGSFPLGKWRYYAVHGQAEGAGEDLRRIAGLVVQ